MKTLPLKSLLFGLFLATTFAVKAQEASAGYEYAEVGIWQVKPTELRIKVMYSDREIEVLEPSIKSSAPLEEQRNAILNVVGVKAKQGWQVYSVNKDGSYVQYFLRRKKQ